jgi:hypothetical protein
MTHWQNVILFLKDGHTRKKKAIVPMDIPVEQIPDISTHSLW